jgi:hypothetical protein
MGVYYAVEVTGVGLEPVALLSLSLSIFSVGSLFVRSLPCLIEPPKASASVDTDDESTGGTGPVDKSEESSVRTEKEQEQNGILSTSGTLDVSKVEMVDLSVRSPPENAGQPLAATPVTMTILPMPTESSHDQLTTGTSAEEPPVRLEDNIETAQKEEGLVAVEVSGKGNSHPDSKESAPLVASAGLVHVVDVDLDMDEEPSL